MYSNEIWFDCNQAENNLEVLVNSRLNLNFSGFFVIVPLLSDVYSAVNFTLGTIKSKEEETSDFGMMEMGNKGFTKNI